MDVPTYIHNHRFEMRLRAELAYSLHVHASRVMLLAVRTGSDSTEGHLTSGTTFGAARSEDSLLCINIAGHKSDLRTKEAIAMTLAPALGMCIWMDGWMDGWMDRYGYDCGQGCGYALLSLRLSASRTRTHTRAHTHMHTRTHA